MCATEKTFYTQDSQIVPDSRKLSLFLNRRVQRKQKHQSICVLVLRTQTTRTRRPYLRMRTGRSYLPAQPQEKNRSSAPCRALLTFSAVRGQITVETGRDLTTCMVAMRRQSLLALGSVYFQMLSDNFFIVDLELVLRFSGPILQTWILFD